MNPAVAEAHEQLRTIIEVAAQAGRELAEANNALLLEEGADWERVGVTVLPSFSSTSLTHAAGLVGEPRLPGLVAQRDQRRVALTTSRDALVDAVLAPNEFEATGARRRLVDDRLGGARSSVKELRARPGVIDAVEAARRGQRVKGALAPIVDQLATLEQSIHALEAEAARLGALVARHHRARKELATVEEQLHAVDDDALREARAMIVDTLIRTPAARRALPGLPGLAGLSEVFHRLAGLEAKRVVLATLHERWVRRFGAELVDLQRSGEHVVGFETVSWPARVQLCVTEAAQTIDAFRRACASVVVFDDYTAVDGDWWAALVPGVAREAHGVAFAVDAGAPAPAPATTAEDKLAAAWAAVAEDARGRTGPRDATTGDVAWPGPGDTEVLPSPLPAERPAPPPVTPASSPPTDAAALFDHFFASSIVRPVAAPGDYGGGGSPTELTATAIANPFSSVPQTAFPPRAPPPPMAMAASTTTTTFAPGNRIGRFEVEALIGRGGMGEVYRARLAGEAGFRRVVVLKRLHLDLTSDAEALRMFAAEAEVAARIAHPNVVQIFDVQAHGPHPFMVMEHLEGLSLLRLATKARSAGIALDRAVLTRCALDAARGLHAAHTMRGDDGNLAGLVHRDVSPDNLFLCSNGFTKLLDFGIARRNDLTTRTRGNELKGKIPFMSPEQILGERLDGRSDLFSLGSTLYQLLSGNRPFVAENDVSTLYAVVHKPHIPVHVVLDDAGDLGDVVEQLLQKRPADRPSSALEVIDALERAGPATPETAAAFLARVWEA
jgi:hypothetical protein